MFDTNMNASMKYIEDTTQMISPLAVKPIENDITEAATTFQSQLGDISKDFLYSIICFISSIEI